LLILDTLSHIYDYANVHGESKTTGSSCI
jgi:hypothetical protein